MGLCALLRSQKLSHVIQFWWPVHACQSPQRRLHLSRLSIAVTPSIVCGPSHYLITLLSERFLSLLHPSLAPHLVPAPSRRQPVSWRVFRELFERSSAPHLRRRSQPAASLAPRPYRAIIYLEILRTPTRNIAVHPQDVFWRGRLWGLRLIQQPNHLW